MCRRFLMLALWGLAAVAWAGDLNDPGFESNYASLWRGPLGGGLHGGSGGGEFIDRSSNGFVRSGDKAACLKVWDHCSSNAVAWSSLSQTVRCEPLARLHAEAWVLASNDTMPLAPTGTIAQLRVEYFSDSDGRSLIPTHAVLSEPFPLAAAHAAEKDWHKLEVSDRVPRDARSLTLSVVLMSEKPGDQPQALWVDDVAVTSVGRAANSN